MQFALSALLAAATVVTAGISQHGDLAARLVGTWRGVRTTPISIKPDSIVMTWRKRPDGRLAGSVAIPGQESYPVTVVWSSDTTFVYESAPHMSHLLHYRVVTRGTARLEGKAIEGSFEARPTRYEGKTISGTFTATRSG